MTIAVLDASPAPADAGLAPLRLAVLARLVCGETASRAELARDLAPLLPPAAARNMIDGELAALVRAGLVIENRSRFAVVPAGAGLAAAELGLKVPPKSWPDVRDLRLVAKALGVERETAAKLRLLGKPEGLRATVLARAFGLKLGASVSASRLRADLAVAALGRAFGDKLRGGLNGKTGLSAKAGRLLAGQLLAKPRDPGTDSRLIAQLAADQAGAASTDAEALRLAILRRYLAGASSHAGKAAAAAPAAGQRAGTPDKAAAPIGGPSRPLSASRPDLAGFAAAVADAAAHHAEGWAGIRKALVCHVWRRIAQDHPEWGLSEIEFKSMLAEAHRTGHLALATADLKDKSRIKELQASAISYKNTVWHFVRVEG